LPPELLFLAQICTKSFFGWGFARDPTGELTAPPPDPELFWGGEWDPRERGRGKEKRGGRGRKGRGGIEKKREGGSKGGEGKG